MLSQYKSRIKYKSRLFGSRLRFDFTHHGSLDKENTTEVPRSCSPPPDLSFLLERSCITIGDQEDIGEPIPPTAKAE